MSGQLTAMDDIRQRKLRCKACGINGQTQPRGLCHGCYMQINVRKKFQPKQEHETESKHAATTREAKRLAACPAGHLPCITCPNIVAVNPLLMARAHRVQCLWSICEDCKASVGTVRDGAVGMRGEYGDHDE